MITYCPLSMRRASYCGAIGSGCFASTLPTQANQQTAAYGALPPFTGAAAKDPLLPRADPRRGH